MKRFKSKACWLKLVYVLFVAVCAGNGQNDVKQVTLLATGFQFPEGPAIDRDGNVYLANVRSSIIHKVAPDGTVSVFADTGGTNQSCAFDAEGNLYVCHNEPGRTGILKIDKDRKITSVALTSDGKPILQTNDMAWGGNGRLYFTAPQGDVIHPRGAIHYIDTDGNTKTFASGLAFANGITFNVDKTYLYVGEERAAQNLGTIWRYKVNADGSADKTGKEPFFQFSGRRYGFDGMKFDVKGNLWVAMYSESELWCISPEGKKIDSISLPGKNPTNLVFGGADRQTVFATVHDGEGSGKLFRVRMPAPGAQ